MRDRARQVADELVKQLAGLSLDDQIGVVGIICETLREAICDACPNGAKRVAVICDHCPNATSFGGVKLREGAVCGGFAPWQERRIKEFLDAAKLLAKDEARLLRKP
jgi:hypothetical protein